MGLQENIWKDLVSDLELREVLTVKPSMKVKDVAALMRRHKLGCVIAVDGDGKPVGKFTERKLMNLLVSDPKGLSQPVSKFMYKSADAIGANESIGKMLKMMQSKSLRFICVTDEEGKAVALTGQKGLMEYVAEHFPRQIKAQRMGSIVSIQEREGA